MIEGPPDTESIGTLFSRLIDDAEQFVRAEIRLYRAQVFDRLRQARAAALLGATAFLLAQSAIFGLVVGLVLILRRPLGPIWATVIVVGGVLIAAALLGGIAFAKVKHLTSIKASIKERPGE